MTDTTPQELIDDLDSLLDQERLALLSGDLEQVAQIALQKESLIDALNAVAPTSQEQLKDLQAKVARNQVLLDGALQGIRKVATRLAALRRIRRSLETYDAQGQKHTIQGEVEHRMEKRA
ncbi:flagellar protein FlgN [Roseovarius sp. 2305UL8-3]|uniref:flagellar protein FlgN n=1 Tax=Roseovarius conchicola TaxID=3121636 RepID=UPI00352846ED